MSNMRDAIENVVNWNRFAGGGDPQNLQEAINKQHALVQEEAKELTEAIFDNDRPEIVKELCDLVVVWGYYSYLTTLQRVLRDGGDRNLITVICAKNEQRGFLRRLMVTTDTIQTNYIQFDGGPVPIDYQGVLGIIMNNVIDDVLQWGADNDHKFFENYERVMASNWSKFPKIEDIPDIEAELDGIKAFYKETKGLDIDIGFSIRIDQDGNERYTFRNRETGKYIKPTVYQKPTMVL